MGCIKPDAIAVVFIQRDTIFWAAFISRMNALQTVSIETATMTTFAGDRSASRHEAFFASPSSFARYSIR